MDPISLITAGIGIVKGLKSIIPFFGDKGKKVAEAIDTIETAVGDVKSDKLPPEAKVELAKATMSHEVQKAAQEIKKTQLIYDDQAGGRDVIKTALLSDDPLVRQARPKMMLMLGKTSIGYTIGTPVVVGLLAYLEVDKETIGLMVQLILWQGATLWSAFTASFTGYTVARTADKKAANGIVPSRLLEKMASLGRRIS